MATVNLSTKTILFTLGLFLLSNCSSEYTPSELNTNRILSTLSSDEMRGRQAFSPDIVKAENFISSEFNEIGLATVEGLNTYKQSFILNEISIKDASLTIGNKNIDKHHYFALLNGNIVDWKPGFTKVVSIKSGEDFREKFQEYASQEEDLLVFIDPSHKNDYKRYHRYYSRPSRSLEQQDHCIVFVLAKESKSFSVSITPEKEEIELTNLVGMIEGERSNEIVLFSAHHDHLGIKTAVEVDSIANGANDDASGVTAVIELARHFKSLGKPERTLLFATFTAEESGGYGSQYFSQQFNPDEIVAMFNIEMIGKPAVSGPNTAWITGYNRSSFGELLSKSAEGTIYEFYPDPYPQQNLFYRSDNATLARLGVPAHSISTTPIDVDKDYHQVSDELGTINISHLTNTINAIAKAARGIISGADTPTRVDTNLVD